jgi:deoxycytidine triphosphate deaminase
MGSFFKSLFQKLAASDQKTIPMRSEATLMSAGILTHKEIEERRLIKNPIKGRLQATSYDLSLGCDYQGEGDDGKARTLTNGEMLIIPQYGVVLVCSKETVETDNLTAGRFDLKIRHALAGLVLQVGTQVEPMYTGQLFGLILNLSDQPVKLFEGDAIFTIEFHTLTTAVERERRTVSGLSEFLRAKNIKDPVKSSLSRIKTDISTELRETLKQHVEQLHAKWDQQVVAQQARQDQSRTNRIVIAFSALFLFLSLFLGIFLPVYINKTTFDRDDALLQQLRSYEAQKVFTDDQSFENLRKIFREHPEEFKKLLEEIQSEQKNSPPTSNNEGETQKRPKGAGGR